MTPSRPVGTSVAGSSKEHGTSLRSRGPVGYRTAGPDGPIVQAGRQRMVESTGWTLSIAGFSFLAGGFALLDSDITLRVLALLVGLSSIGQGVMRLIATRRGQSASKGRIRDVVIGTALIAIGTLVLFSPSAGQRGLVIGTAAWFALIGIQELLGSSPGRRSWDILLFVGSVAIAVVLLLNPEMTLAALSRFIAVGLFVRGFLLLRRLRDRMTVTRKES